MLNTHTAEISKYRFKFPSNFELISADDQKMDIYIYINGVLNTHTDEISKYGFKFAFNFKLISADGHKRGIYIYIMVC